MERKTYTLTERTVLTSIPAASNARKTSLMMLSTSSNAMSHGCATKNVTGSDEGVVVPTVGDAVGDEAVGLCDRGRVGDDDDVGNLVGEGIGVDVGDCVGATSAKVGVGDDVDVVDSGFGADVGRDAVGGTVGTSVGDGVGIHVGSALVADVGVKPLSVLPLSDDARVGDDVGVAVGEDVGVAVGEHVNEPPFATHLTVC